MRPLCAGKRRRREDSRGGNRSCRLHMQLHALVAKQVDAGTSMNPSTPVTPSERFSPDHEGMQQYTNLARLFGGTALPLTLFTQRTGTTTANAGPIHPHDAQRGGLLKQSGGRVDDSPRLHLLLPQHALVYCSFWFSTRLPAWKKPGLEEGMRSPRMNPIRKEGVG